jgi:hypothetical protein
MGREFTINRNPKPINPLKTQGFHPARLLDSPLIRTLKTKPKESKMKTLKTFLPLVAVLGVLAAAVWHVQSEAAVRAATVEAIKVSSVQPSTLPPSDRYSGNPGVAN